MFLKATLAAVCAAIAALAGAPVLAARCQDAQIEVINNRNSEIKVFRVEYRDQNDNRTRTNDLNNDTIGSGRSFTFRETLENVGGEPVPWVAVEFKFKESNGWSTKRWSSHGTGADVCGRNEHFTVTVN